MTFNINLFFFIHDIKTLKSFLWNFREQCFYKTAIDNAKEENHTEIVDILSKAAEKERKKEYKEIFEAFKEEHNKLIEEFKNEHKKQIEEFIDEHIKQMEEKEEEYEKQLDEKNKEIQRLMDMIKMLQNQS